MTRSIFSLGLVLIFLIGTGCSISTSSESISNSISSPFKWSSSVSDSSTSSDSSSPDDDDRDDEPEEKPQAEEARYQQDVSELAFAFARDHEKPTDDQIASFRAGVGRIAQRHGITDWEADPQSMAGIGAGFARAGVSKEEAAELSKGLFGSDDVKRRELESSLAAAN